jgi:hypothetical protein
VAIGVQAYREGLSVQDYIRGNVPTSGSVNQSFTGSGRCTLRIECNRDNEGTVNNLCFHVCKPI